MGAAHIVRHDFQLGLGVDPSPVGQQQIAAQLGRVGALGIAGNTDGTVEDRVGLATGQAFLQLIQLPLRARQNARRYGWPAAVRRPVSAKPLSTVECAWPSTCTTRGSTRPKLQP